MIDITEKQRKLVEDNHNLIYSFLAKNHLSQENYYDIAAIGLCKAGSTYSGEKSKLSTYAYKCMINEVLQDIRKECSSKRIPNDKIVYYETDMGDERKDDDTFLKILPSNENVENEIISKIMFDERIKNLSERDKKILELFSKGYKQQKIGDVVNCSQAQISRIKRKIKKLILEENAD